MAVCTLFLEKSIKDPHTPKSRPNKDTHKLETLGHIPSSEEQGWRKCYLCGQRWSNHARLRMEKLGHCPGPNVWGRVPDAPSLTWRAPIGSKLIHNGHTLHHSHALHWHRGIIFCNKCGNYSVKKVVNLALKCPLKCKGAYGTNVLKRLRGGQVPYTGCKFPLGVDDACPSHISGHLSDQ